MTTIGKSGCFGSQPKNETIDNVAEVSATVDDIMDDVVVPTDATAEEASATLLLQHYSYMDRRVRLLTYLVVALSVVVLMKEL